MSPGFGKILPAIALAALLAGCASKEAAQYEARQAYSLCVTGAAARLDDGKSDPASVGQGVAAACSGAYARLSAVEIGSMFTENGQFYMADKMRDNETRFATKAVLTYRAEHRK